METNIKILLAVCMLIVFIVTLLGALLPLKVFGRRTNQSQAQTERSDKIRSLCNCLAGGVFLTTCFLGLIPSARNKFVEVFAASNYKTDYPVCEAVVIAGFFLILALEQAITATQDRKAAQTVDYMQLQQIESDIDTHLNVEEEEDEDEVIFASPSQSRVESNPLPNGKSTNGMVHHSHWPGASENSHSHHGHSHYGNVGSTNVLHSVILLLALSVHSVFEGMALGLQEDIKQITYLLVAMVAHESLAAFALGASLLKSEVRLSAYIVYGVIFSSMIPIGTAIGVGIQSSHSFSADVCSAVMQSVAAGIFIFVTFFEILNHEFENEKYRWRKLLFTALGYVALALLEIVG
ncbi:zinc transporter ZIP3-like [Lytechinus pictus]|uniref:zinc transporter ZIP3-like n=1 Tax=Lytechinus pictus TaxID=7653 RepID=UPI0030B9D7F4